MLNLITSALGWKTIFRKQMFNKIFWDGSINVINRAMRVPCGRCRLSRKSNSRAVDFTLYLLRRGS